MKLLLVITFLVVSNSALALDGSYDAPPVGARFSYDHTTYTVNEINDYSIITSDAERNKYINFGHFVTYANDHWRKSSFRVNTEKVEDFWPLKVGKSVRYDISNLGDRWRATLTVVAVEVVRTPAGKFQCFKVSRKREAVSGPWSDESTLWFSPSINFIVKWESKTTGGRNYGATNGGVLVSFNIPENSDTNSGNIANEISSTKKTNGQKDKNLEYRLEKAKELYDKGLITKNEYDKKRQSILNDL